jgi:hypothetical protein
MARIRKSASALFDAIILEGNLISPAMLTRIAAREAGSQAESDYRVPKGLTLRDEIARYFRIGQALFAGLFASPTPSTGATSAFVEALMRDVFGFSDMCRIGTRLHGERVFAVTLEGRGGRVPVVVVPPSDDLDRASVHLSTDGRRRSASSSVQDWLNTNDDALWGFCCNGERLRLLRDNASLTRPAYVEANLRQLFDGEDFADFAAFWLLIHASRFGAAGLPVADCALERWREEGSKQGEVARDRLRDGVKAALLALGNGFLRHQDNAALRERVVKAQLPLPEFFGELLRLVYRLIFLLAAEDRGLLHPPGVSPTVRKLYADGYSVGSLRDAAVRRAAWDRHHDRWEGLLVTFRALAQGEPQLGLPPLGGIFDNVVPDLERARLSNRSLMDAIYRLAWLKDPASLIPVNWRDMEAEELGSVYESLLELTPRLLDDGRGFAFAEGVETKGNERKTSGSYYTPDSLVQTLLDSTLDPVLDRVESEADNPAEALLGVTVIDPACGSGHFLLAAARRIATRVAHARAEGVTSIEDYRRALRDVARSCIHGADRNPLAVELTKVALWIETVEPGKPLGFLDANIRCGDSLFGVFDLEILKDGIPDAAYKPLAGDNKVTARDFERRNKAERGGQGRLRLLGGSGQLPAPPPLAGVARALRELPEDDAEQVAAKRKEFDNAQKDPLRWNWRIAADAYVAAFLVAKTKKDLASDKKATIPTTDDLWHVISGDQLYGPLVGKVQELAITARAFHWPLEFPDVMAAGGFDVVIGNPPWERIKLQEQEFFAAREPEIAEAPNAAARGRMIMALKEAEPNTRERRLYEEYETAKRIAEASSVFARVAKDKGGRFPLTGRGDVNTYALFAELFASLHRPHGRAGVIVPTGIATDATTAPFFAAMVDEQRLAHLVDFENREAIFPAVHRSYKFSLLTLASEVKKTGFAFFLTAPAQLGDSERQFTLSSAEIARINPNTKTALVSRARADAELTGRIYARVPVLIDDAKGTAGNAWSFRYMTKMFDMADNSAQFRTAEQLSAAGLVREGTDWVSAKTALSQASKLTTDGHGEAPGAERYVPLYEAKMISLYDHRASSYAGRGNERGNRVLPETSEEQHHDPGYEVEPFYWLPSADLEARIDRQLWNRSWLMGWKDVTTATTERTVIATAFPRVAVGHTIRVMFADGGPVSPAMLFANLSSLVLDYVARQKVSYLHLTVETLKQLPTLPPASYTPVALDFIIPRVLELSYTSYAMAPFACDLGYNGPPFAWDENRRARLRAELDAWYARAYGLTRDELRYILDPADVKGAAYPSETFRVLKNNEIKRFGEYRTRRLVLEAWDRLEKDEFLEIRTPVATVPAFIHPGTLPDGAWAAASDSPSYTITQLAALIHRLPGPAPINRVRLAALFALQPRYMTRRLSGEQLAMWLRLIGSAAEIPKAVNVIAFAQKIDVKWGKAVTQLRGMGEIVEDVEARTWASGSGTSKYATDGWADGRAEFVLRALEGLGIDELTADLPSEDQAWVRSVNVA